METVEKSVLNDGPINKLIRACATNLSPNQDICHVYVSLNFIQQNVYRKIK